MTPPLVQIAGISKDYRGLRPLRIQELTVAPGESVALVGFDELSAEVLVNLVTGATLPDTGEVIVFGRSTREISDSQDWLSFVDRIGIVSRRAALLESLTIAQNLAMPFTLDIDPLSEDARVRAHRLAAEAGLPEPLWNAPVGPLDAAAKVRVRAARAAALDPQLFLIEHASAELTAAQAASVGADLRRTAAARRAAVLAVTADEAFARAVAARVLRWQPASGRLVERRGWFRGRLG